ncbi:methanol--corrinoid protein co-methyltransferase MtaB [Methanosphaera cuniculi]|uniref:Methanol-5-hydroxybenzimidazolylcobamide methyltransferase n=2 Tax=Methanosphaera TaxID=2316 RepID=A0A2A2HD86_9EURY|nr:methanol--corrinoid protein co-methyltransferase MtaB [Methanosphaera cuniculi]PAV07290.1 methanol-5-hydroxybenzimidazolylcobamide methyltransferase [Methanosphaera cuniculi]PWL08982.1 methanol-cobalamin methyltransferase B subunit [Methanosphaera cuniculi]
MSRKYYTKMETEDVDDMVFGQTKNPVKMGLDQVVGDGEVIPNIKVAPAEGSETSIDGLVATCKNIAFAACERAAGIGLPAIQIEQEHVQQQSISEEASARTTAVQWEQLEELHEKYGTAVSLMSTVADMREEENGLRGSELDQAMDASFEACAENGASMLCVETVGGKVVSDYGISRGDVRAILYGIGVLGSIDMAYMWPKIVDIAKKNNIVAGGDTDCAQANTAMFLAGALTSKNVSHTIAAVARAIAGARSLVAIECGATGPTKDCGYENPIVKSIASVPICAEGKNATCAHSDLMGNLAAAVCDVWSNESVYNREEMGGPTPGVWLQSLGYECALMNTATQIGTNKELRDTYTLADKYRDPQGVILAYDNAYKIGEAIVADGEDIYLRSRNAALKACELINEAVEEKRILLTRFERDTLDSTQKTYEQLPDDQAKFVKTCIKRYGRKVKEHDPSQYEL